MPAETWYRQTEPPCVPGEGPWGPWPCQREAEPDGCWRVLCGPLTLAKTPWEAVIGENVYLVCSQGWDPNLPTGSSQGQ